MVPILRQVRAALRPLGRSLLLLALSLLLIFGPSDGAWAARSGGRIGGGSFRAPSRTYRAPSGGAYRGGGGYFPGGGFFSPFMPFYGVGFGGGGLLSLLVMMAVAAYLVQSLRNAFGSDLADEDNPTIAVSQVRVGLMAQARNLQEDLDRIAFNADTSTSAGQAQVLQEVSLALLRHPEYWIYGSATTDRPKLVAAEATFNRLAMAERSKFSQETLTNLQGRVQSPPVLTPAGSDLAVAPTAIAPGEYVVVTMLVAAQAQLNLPAVNSEADMKQVLQQIGSLPADRLLAIEVVWTPQEPEDSLSADDIMANYPDLKLV